MSKNKVLVLGSKSEAFIPKENFCKIYTANGAAERVAEIIKTNQGCQHICVVGAREFLGNQNVSSRIIKSNPSKVYIRGGFLNNDDFYPAKCEIINTSNNEQLKFQTKFLKFGFLDIVFGESNYKIDFFSKLKHLLKISIGSKKFQGISTGFYAMLLAFYENKSSEIYVAGIGMSGGKQYYKNERNEILDYTPRSRVDRYVVTRLKKNIINKFITSDKELSEVSKIKLDVKQ